MCISESNEDIRKSDATRKVKCIAILNRSIKIIKVTEESIVMVGFLSHLGDIVLSLHFCCIRFHMQIHKLDCMSPHCRLCNGIFDFISWRMNSFFCNCKYLGTRCYIRVKFGMESKCDCHEWKSKDSSQNIMSSGRFNEAKMDIRHILYHLSPLIPLDVHVAFGCPFCICFMSMLESGIVAQF